MNEFFREYTNAFDALDANEIASLYRIPCAISDADGDQVFSDKSALIKKFEANCKALRELGYQGAQFNIIEQQQLEQDKKSVTIGWRIETAVSNIEARTLYICHKINGSWCIFSTNVYSGGFSD